VSREVASQSARRRRTDGPIAMSHAAAADGRGVATFAQTTLIDIGVDLRTCRRARDKSAWEASKTSSLTIASG
jgi:hypothetical protein